MGTVLAMQRREAKARRCFDESTRVAELQEARYELARARLFRGRAGLEFGWKDAEQEVASTQTEIDRMTAFWHE